MRRIRVTLPVIALSALFALVAFFGVGFFRDVQFAQAQQKVEATRQQLSQIENLAELFRQVGQAVEPSVVNINVRKTLRNARQDEDPLRRFFQNPLPDRNRDGAPDMPPDFGDGGDSIVMGTGSGVIMEASDGAAYILTNNHVAGGAEEMTITLNDGREIDNGKLLGADPKTDLAVVKVQADRVIAAKWGDSDKLQRGDWVLAFGSPFGYVGSMTHGIVSATNRNNVGILGNNGYEDFIQVDAPINPGNSGGPLVDVHGEVVGINTAIASRSGGFQGIGFAIPSNLAKSVYEQLKTSGKVQRGWLGVRISDVSDPRTEPIARRFGYKGADGVFVQETFPDTPAYGKLQPGDIVTQLDGKDVKDTNQLRNAIAAIKAGSQVTLNVFRGGKQQDVQLEVGQQPDNLAAVGRPGGGGEEGSQGATSGTLGMELATITPELAQRFGLENGPAAGALVASVNPRSDAAKAGIRRGDVITKINGEPVKTADEAVSALKDADLSKGVVLYVTSREGSRFVFINSDNKK